MSPNSTASLSPPVAADELGEIFGQISEKVQAGEPVDVEEYAARYPQYARQLRRLLPTMAALNDLGYQEAAREIAWEGQGPTIAGSNGRAASVSGAAALKDGVLGDFRIVRELGRGGMGIVYEAEQITLGRKVALKILPFAAILDETQLKRFKNEARAAATLKHPNIVSVYSVGVERSVHFFAMELVEGRSLAQVISTLREEVSGQESEVRSQASEVARKEPLTTDDALPGNEESEICNQKSELETSPLAALSTDYQTDPRRYFQTVARLGMQAAEALAHAHEQGIIHRDVKPGNMMLDSMGKLLVTDFGLARIGTEKSMTVSGDLLGTLRYMSPEQALAKRVVVDHRTDIYSLGVTLYELATLRPAFDGTDRQELLRQVAFENPRPPRQVNPEVPRDLETIIVKSMAKDPAGRYGTAAELAEDLQRYVETRPIIARRPSRLSIAANWVRRNRTVAALAAAALLLLTTLAVLGPIVAVAQGRLARERQGLLTEKTELVHRQNLALYARDMQLANRSIDEGRRVEAERLLKKWVPEKGENDKRGFEWFYLWNRCHDPAIERTILHELPVYDVAFLDDPSRLAVVGLALNVAVWDLAQNPLTVPVHKLPAKNVSVTALYPVSGSSELVSGDDDGGIDVWDTRSGVRLEHIRLETPVDQNMANTLDVSPDGRLMVFGVGSLGIGHVHVWDRDQREWALKVNEVPGHGLAVFGPRGNLVVVPGRGRTLQLYSREDWSVIAERKIDAEQIMTIEISPDRALLAVATKKRYGIHTVGYVEVWSTSDWQRKAIIPLDLAVPQSIAFAPDGSLMAVGDEGGRLLVFETSGFNAVGAVQAHALDVRGLSFSSDGRRLASASTDEMVHVWSVAALRDRQHEPCVTRRESGNGTWGTAFLNQGRTAANSDGHGNVYLWDARTGALERQLHVEQPHANLVHLTASPDEKLLAVTRGYFPPQPELPGRLEFIDIKSGSVHSSHEIYGNFIYSHSSFSADGRYFAAACGLEVVVVDVPNRREACRLKLESMAKSPSFSPDGRWLACCDTDGFTHFYDAQDFSFSHRIRTDEEVTECIDFHPDGRIIAVVGVDPSVRLFDAETGERLAEFKETPTFTAYVRFSPDGERLVSASTDGIARIWHVETGEELLTLRFPTAGIGSFPAAEFSPDGNALLLSCGNWSQVYRGADPEDVANLSVAELDELACQTITQMMQSFPKLDLAGSDPAHSPTRVLENADEPQQ